MKRPKCYSMTAREPLLSQEARALEIRLRRLLDRIDDAKAIDARLNELLRQQAARAAEIRAMEQAVERLLGRLGPLNEALTAKVLPVPPAPSYAVLPSIYCSFPPPRPQHRVDMSKTALGQWLIARQKRRPIIHFERARS